VGFARRVWQLATRIDRTALVFARPARAAVVSFIGLGLLVRHGDIRIALPFGVGVLFTAMSDHGGPLRQRMPTMIGTAVAITFGTLLGGLVSDSTVANIVVGGLLALACGFAGAAGPNWMFGGVLTLVVYTIFGGAPIQLLAIGQNMVWMGIGCAVLIASAALAHGVARLRSRAPTAPDPAGSSDSPWVQARAHLHRHDLFVGHAVRLSLVLMVAIVLERELDYPHSYWIPMTVAWITRPDRQGTVERTILRVIGTLVGIVIAGMFIIRIEPGNGLSVLMASIAVFIVLTFLVPNYAIAVTGITIFVFFLFDIVGYPVDQMIETRMVSTLIAAALVLVAVHLGPRRNQLSTPS